MQDDELKRLERLNPIIQVAVEMGLPVRGNLGHCFHTERHVGEESPTLFFNVARNTFLCKSCDDVGGGVVDFVCQFKAWDRQEAIAWLSHRVEFDQHTRAMYYSKGKKRG